MRCVRNDLRSTVQCQLRRTQHSLQQSLCALSYCELNGKTEGKKEEKESALLCFFKHSNRTQYTTKARRCLRTRLYWACAAPRANLIGGRDILCALPADKHNNQHKYTSAVYMHARTHVRAQHQREWVRSEGQTPSMRHITATAVGLTSTSRAPASPKPPHPSLAALSASHPCDTTHTHTKWRGKKKRNREKTQQHKRLVIVSA